jgi:hypothetical protein
MSVIYLLSEQQPITSGGEKLVFQHPESDDLLIKVWRKRYYDELKKKHSFLCRYLRTPRYSALLKEVIEHVAVREYGSNHGYLQNICGFVDTDLGLGMVVETIRDENGYLAKSLADLVEGHIFGAMHRRALEKLLEWLESTHVIVRDFTLNNLVWDEKNGMFVIVDGIGSRPVLSLRMFSKKYNRYSMKKKISKLRMRLERALEKNTAANN